MQEWPATRFLRSYADGFNGYGLDWKYPVAAVIDMNLILRAWFSTTILLLTLPAMAQDSRPATITAREAKPVPIDSVIPELAGIVVLCATDSGSTEFEDQWRTYVRRHGVDEAELGHLIFRVINDAEAYRGNRRLNRGESPDAARDRRAKTYRRMQDAALNEIRRKR